MDRKSIISKLRVFANIAGQQVMGNEGKPELMLVDRDDVVAISEAVAILEEVDRICRLIIQLPQEKPKRLE